MPQNYLLADTQCISYVAQAIKIYSCTDFWKTMQQIWEAIQAGDMNFYKLATEGGWLLLMFSVVCCCRADAAAPTATWAVCGFIG